MENEQMLKERISNLEMKLYALGRSNLDRELKTQSDSIDLLMTAFCAALPEYGELKKSKTGNRGAYATLQDYKDATKMALQKNGLIFFFYRTIVGTKMYFRARLQHVSGQFFESITIAPYTEEPDGVLAGECQSVLSRLARYLSRDVLGIGEEESEILISEKQLKLLKDLVATRNGAESKILEQCKVKSLADLTPDKASYYIRSFIKQK